MSIYSVASVTQDPNIQLVNWAIKHTNEGDFFVGTDVVYGDGRVSTKVVQYDPDTQRGVTKSGRCYELVGNSGYSRDGEYVWASYKRVNQLTELEE